jgi:hypothetical protein
MVRLFNILDYWAQLAQSVWRCWTASDTVANQQIAMRVVAKPFFETVNKCIASAHPPPDGGGGIKQILY